MTVIGKAENAEVLFGVGFTEAERAALEGRMKSIGMKLQQEAKKAYFKLEVTFNGARSVHKPFPGIVTVWESGSKFHGGGDSKLYFCPGNERLGNSCKAILPDGARGMNMFACGVCGNLWDIEDVHGEVGYCLPVNKWADVLLSWFVRLDMDADIRIKYARDDIRVVAQREQDKQLGGELLRKARSAERRTTSIYPMANIIKDTSNGGDLYARILAFLKS